jgi:predicted DNA-binding transcriptional regulator AlpA
LPPKKKNRRGPRPGTLHIDARAADLAAEPGSDDEQLTTKQLADWFGVSEQWVEIARTKGTGPPFERLGPRMIRYQRGSTRRWLGQRTHHRTSEYTQSNRASDGRGDDDDEI